jgi:hypothetical protein
MKNLPGKLNYKGQERIAVINAEESFYILLSGELGEVIIDREIDPRFPYNFIILFVKAVSDVEHFTPIVLHNLMADGVLWYCYPKKTSLKYSSDINPDNGWQILNDSGLHGVRMVAIDENWSAMRFRNIKYVRSSFERFTK